MFGRPNLLRRLVLLACILLAAAAPARAQSTPAPAAAPSSVSADELERLVGTLQDDAARKKLVEQLRGLVAAQRGVEQQESAEGAAGFLTGLSRQIDAISGEILATAAVVIDAPWLVTWLERQASDPAAREFWLEVGLKLAVIFGCALCAEWLARTALRRPAARLVARSGTGLAVRLLLLALGAVLEVLPILAFAATAYFVLPLTQPRFGTQQVALVLVGASLWARTVLAVARVALLSPNAVALYPMGEETRNYLYIWARRFINWSVYGYAVSEGAWWLGVLGAIYALLLRGTALVLAVLAVIFVLQNRIAIAEWLRGRGDRVLDEGAVAVVGAPAWFESRGWRVMRHRLADTWHVLAIIYVIGIFTVYVLRIEGGFYFVLRATVVSVVVLLAAALIVRFIQQMSRRGFAINPELKGRFPTLEARANRYVPVLTLVTSAVIYFFAGLALLQAWGANSFSWLASTAGHRITGGLITIGTVLATALILWELFSSAIERYLTATDGDGRPMARSGRMRTLLPLLRTTVLVLLIVMVGLIVLSELGVNIAPLLAGAGVVGLAIGFGSQALVKDVITGLFILIEDTLGVGDVVDVGKGHSGVVEAISIRTIRLRDTAGVVHTVPFSEVTTIRNLTKDFAFHVIEAGVSYREDTDEVIAVLQEVAADLRQDTQFAPFMLEPIEIIGVDRFEASAVIVKARIKTIAMKQWMVGREFNRRMKKAFDRHGIEMPYPHQTIYFGEEKRGGAPPVHVRLELPDAAGALAPPPADSGPG